MLSATLLSLFPPLFILPLTLATIAPRQPTPDPLSSLNASSSTLYPTASSIPPTDPCGITLAPIGGGLSFPRAGFVGAVDGTVECGWHRLVFEGLPAGWGFTVLAVSVGGNVELGEQAGLREVRVGVGYFDNPSDTKPAVTDSAVETDLGEKYPGGYSGTINLILNVFSENTNGTQARGRTSCATATEQPEIDIRFGLSTSHEEEEGENGTAYEASVSDLTLELSVMWEQCDGL
ncbi:uncharacterized protein C8A04DRAFT_30707 [Dichotomopilus funicola]|uniref:Uncharacterized protein n=1 Tax=Dichotomopilus funicola TaxID=1934379 RepID=A0AAN6UZ01_9PEZI|nr:hypothetical protein C8A04DRAFT_30707 [Dichotomopilus funicola]